MMMADELGYISTETVSLFASLEVFHDYILAHDDIIDQDDTRRGSPTLHTAMQSNLAIYTIPDRKHFGQAQAIIGGDVLYSICQDMVLDSDIKASRKIILLKILTQTMQHVARGRYKQFLSDYIPLDDISLDDIIQHNLINVTSSYTFLFPLQFGQAVATGDGTISDDLRLFADNLGILFQTGDDIIGLFGDPTVTGKSASGDIIQGKKTIPMYLTYQHATESEQKFLNEKV
jgi:geranylgeranyl diphosphate synthase, type I